MSTRVVNLVTRILAQRAKRNGFLDADCIPHLPVRSEPYIDQPRA